MKFDDDDDVCIWGIKHFNDVSPVSTSWRTTADVLNTSTFWFILYKYFGLYEASENKPVGRRCYELLLTEMRKQTELVGFILKAF